jgi:hypothetical protein
VGAFGFMKTSRIKINDIEKAVEDKGINYLLYLASDTFIDHKLVFKVKSTGELLCFDKFGMWYEEGLNH